MAKPVVAIVGRPNVGKSTLFNRIVGQRISIIEDTPGVTRDRIYSDAEWLNREFILVDTGGIDYMAGDEIKGSIRRQAQIAIDEADVIIFVVDGREGLTATDQEIFDQLRRSAKPVVLAVNKVEDFVGDYSDYEFYALGMGDLVKLSAAHGMNVGDLLDRVTDRFPVIEAEGYGEDIIRISVVGRPNVGKSSLVNRILGQERVIVSDIPGTTRDSIDVPFVRGDRRYVLIDTAGMRRKSRISDPVERYSIIRALRAVDRSDIALIVVDAREGITDQDVNIARYVHEQAKAAVVVVNKWDLIDKEGNTMRDTEMIIRSALPFMGYARMHFISALTGRRVDRLLPLVDEVADEYGKRVSTALLNQVIQDAIMRNQPPTDKGRRLKIYYGTQLGVKPPFIVIFVNEPELVHFSYKRYLDNSLREAFGFEGSPLILGFRKRE